MNENTVNIMIKKVLDIETNENIDRFKTSGEMKKDAVKKIMAALEEVTQNENKID